MAAGRIVLSQFAPARDRNDALVAGAKMYVYTNGTTTLASIYTSATLGTALANPVVANSSGQFAQVWADASLTYTVSVTGPNGESIGNPSVFDDYSPSTNFAVSEVEEYKSPVRVASTADITIASALINGSTIDGVVVATGDRVLLKDQSTGSQNGIYVVVASGAASRSGDADTSAKVTSGMTMFVSEGTASGGTVYTLTTADPITLGTTALTFSQSPGVVGAGVAAFLATPSSANLRTAVTDETGTGALVFANSPTLVTPALGTPSSMTLTNATGLPVAGGGTGAATAADARTNLGLVIGTNVQAFDTDLTAIAALTSAADKVPYATGAGTWALADLTSFARTLLATANNSTFLTALGQIASSFVDFLQAGTGAITRTVQSKLRDRVNLLDYVPVAQHAAILAGTSTYDATADLQAAIAANLGKTIDLPAGQIVLGNVGGLASAGQRIIGDSRYGTVIKAKSAMTAATAIFYSPDAATSTSAYMELANLRFRFDGQNIIGIDLSSLNNTVVDQCYFAGSEAGASVIGVGVRFGSPLDSGSYSNNVRDCAFYSLAKGVEYLINANSNMISGGECIFCTIGVDAAPTGYLDTPRIHGMRFEGGGIGIKEKSVGATYFQCRFEDNSVADISFINNGGGDQSIRPQLIGGETATSPVSLLNVSNAVSPIIIAPDMGRYDIDATSTPKYYGGRHIFAGVGSALPPASNPPGGYSVCFIDPPYLRNQIPFEGINSAGTNTVVMMAVNGSDDLEISGFKRASSTYATVRIGGGSAVAPLTNGGTDLGETGRRWKDYYGGGNVFANGALSLESAGSLVYINGVPILKAQRAAVADATGGAVVDAEARTAINALLARLRDHGLIAT